MSGRARDNRLVHATVPRRPGSAPASGDISDAVVTYAAPHHLMADAGLQAAPANPWWRRVGGPAGSAACGPTVVLGMPTVGRPAESADLSGLLG